MIYIYKSPTCPFEFNIFIGISDSILRFPVSFSASIYLSGGLHPFLVFLIFPQKDIQNDILYQVCLFYQFKKCFEDIFRKVKKNCSRQKLCDCFFGKIFAYILQGLAEFTFVLNSE